MDILLVPPSTILNSKNLLKLWKQKDLNFFLECENKVDEHVNTFEAC
jgi:hypothetical protein